MKHNNKPIDIRPIDIRPIDIRSIDIRPIDVRPIDVKPLSNYDIERILRKYNIKVYMRDEPQTGTRVINLDSMNGPGTHWVGLYETPHKVYYFDSYGLPPPEEVKYNIPIMYSTQRIQADDSIMCGYYVCKFLEDMMMGKTFYDFIYDWGAPEYNESLIIKYYMSKL